MSGMTVSKADFNTMATHLGTDWQSNAKKGVDFTQEHPTTALRVPVSGALGAAVGAGVGMGAGALLSTVAPVSAPIAIKTGGALGAAIVGALAIKYEIVMIQESNVYATWKEKRTQEVNDLFKKYLQDNQLEEFFCPITLELIVTPVYHKHNKKHLFERAEILKLIQQQKDKAACPCCRNPIQESGLVYDLEYHRRVLPLMPLSPQQQLALPQPKNLSPSPIEVNVQNPSSAATAVASPTPSPRKMAETNAITSG